MTSFRRLTHVLWIVALGHGLVYIHGQVSQTATRQAIVLVLDLIWQDRSLIAYIRALEYKIELVCLIGMRA